MAEVQKRETRFQGKKSIILRKLFFATFYLSAFTFGGGYVIVTLLKEKFVDRYHWIDEDEMLDLVAIAQSSPGAIAVNGAIVVGYKLAGIPGVLVSVMGAVLPPMIVLSLISFIYDIFITNSYVAAVLDGMSAGVGAVIASVVYDMGGKFIREKDWGKSVLMIFCFIAGYFFDINVIYIILFAAALGAVCTVAEEKRVEAGKKEEGK